MRPSTIGHKAIFTAAILISTVAVASPAYAGSSHLLADEINYQELCGNDRDCRIEVSRRSTLRALQKASDAHEKYINVIDREGRRICDASTTAMDFLGELAGVGRVTRAQRYTLARLKGARNKMKALARGYKRKGDRQTARKFERIARQYDREYRRHKNTKKVIKNEFEGIGSRTRKMRCGRFAPTNH